MGNLARNLQQQQQERHNEVQKQHRSEKKNAFWLSPGEKVLGLAFAGMVCFGAIHIISNQADIYKVNKQIQEVQSSIKEQQKVNSDLNVQVSELSTYERILTKAKKMGLVLNENNVKVVQ
ncbi:cell division protein FtsL [Neobacillus sp. PS3-40]|uniref:cell division protein FtsL n=1 Tax=Neobacillus sp. PS3-40 TaxID=3070679 RepID=UPI0027DFD865|nr:cell division protein FtsL [Neobacillus sp. PS3-40]WML43608.1 cell division protein FtsL [Neobacillus sp. PS3-40]